MKNRLNLIRLHKRKLLRKWYKQGKHIHQPTHFHNHNNQAVATMESCLALIAVIGVHKHGIAFGPMNEENPCLCKPPTSEASAKHSFKPQLRTTHVWSLGTERQFSNDRRGEGGSWVDVCVPAFALSLSFENSELNRSTA